MPSPAPRPEASRVCRKCQRELPATEEYFRPTRAFGTGLRGVCRVCTNKSLQQLRTRNAEIGREVRKSEVGAFRPRVVKDGSLEGDYTEYPDDGYRVVFLPDSHGYLIDWPAAEAALAFVRFYKPVRIFLLGDHVDFAAISRFDKPPSDIGRIGEDVEACGKFLGKVRESAPDAKITYLKGNHEARFARFLWKHPEAAAMLKAQGLDLPRFLNLGEHNIEWEESGTQIINERLMAKHGHMVRMRSGYTATGELERNGISGVSGHTHRLGQIYKRNRTGVMTWVESGCLCTLDPDYMEGQLSDWAQGLSFGTVSLKGRGFSVHTAPIIRGKTKALGKDIGP